MARSTVTGVVKLMERKGLIRRESVSSDARLKKLVLTEKGISAHRTMYGIIQECEKSSCRGYDAGRTAMVSLTAETDARKSGVTEPLQRRQTVSVSSAAGFAERRKPETDFVRR